ncbi:tripartite ATP-independent transporter DctM subunit [Paraburkholderia sp. BL6665CI2N2]|uniref:TRAP transporter large permease n=1 Tax=Paraburkholderia sp. BL6665CI2N2 TaxID=1938806 RepID=UPI001065DF04|nr:TRAP transporter large permease subunit [Paraburkholderia sp. BL6665CI2N2]TDY22032.1 tripartite ATP-independent transporter DctM subunit [Paraburkholderia sp. BL6665CI2N2]
MAHTLRVFHAEASSTAGKCEGVLETLLYVGAGVLLVVEVILLAAGVLARYVFDKPLVWSDELSSILFIWLAVFGACIAFRRGEHMRMTSLSTRTSERTRRFLDVMAVVLPMVFLSLIVQSAYDYAAAQSFMTMPALEISGAWRAAALPVGLALMWAFGLLELIRHRHFVSVCWAVGLSVTVAYGLHLGMPLFAEFGKWNLAIFFVGFVSMGVFSGIPIAFCFGLATVAYLQLTTPVPLMVLMGRLDEGMSHQILLAIPLFIFLGFLMEATGMARRIVEFFASVVSHRKDGLSYVLVGAMYTVSGISGSKSADIAAIAPALVPEMRRRGESDGEVAALLSATGAQTETIPPSLALIAISSAAGVSTSALFTGGMLPGAVMGLLLCWYVWWRKRRSEATGGSRSSVRDAMTKLMTALPALVLPFLIKSAVVEGVATATEVSTIGIFYAIVYSAVLGGGMSWSTVGKMLVRTTSLAGAILFIVGTATSMSWALTQSGFSQDLASALLHLPGGAITFWIVSIAVFVVIGSVLEGIPAIALLAPLLLPIAKGLSINEVHYSMVIILSMGIGYFVPPFGIGYYTTCAIAGVDPNAAMRPMLGFIVVLALGVAIIAAVPWLSTGFLH